MPDDVFGGGVLNGSGGGLGGYEPPMELGMRRLVALLDAHCTPARGSGEHKRWTCIRPEHEGNDPSVYASTVDTVVWADLSAAGERGAHWNCESCLVGGPVSGLVARLFHVEVEEAEKRLVQRLTEEGTLAHPRFASREQLDEAAEQRRANYDLWNPDT